MKATDIFPSLKTMSVEKVLLMQSLIDQYGVGQVIEAITAECVEGEHCENCPASDVCTRHKEYYARKILES